MRVADEVWVWDDAFIAWVEECEEGQEEGAAGAAGDEGGGGGGELVGFALSGDGTVPAEIEFEPVDDFGKESGVALGEGVAVFVGVDGGDGGGADGFWDGEVWLPDGEVDGVFEGSGEVEDSSDAGCVDSACTIRDEMLDHVNLFSFGCWMSNLLMGLNCLQAVLLADFGFLKTKSTFVAGVLFFILEGGNAFGAFHDIALGGEIAFGLE